MTPALKLATLIPGTEAPGSKDRKVLPFVGSRTPSERLQLAGAPVLDRFNSDSGFGVRRRVQSPDTDPLKPSKPASATTSEVSFGPFRLLPAQFLLLEGDRAYESRNSQRSEREVPALVVDAGRGMNVQTQIDDGFASFLEQKEVEITPFISPPIRLNTSAAGNDKSPSLRRRLEFSVFRKIEIWRDIIPVVALALALVLTVWTRQTAAYSDIQPHSFKQSPLLPASKETAP